MIQFIFHSAFSGSTGTPLLMELPRNTYVGGVVYSGCIVQNDGIAKRAASVYEKLQGFAMTYMIINYRFCFN